MARAANAPDRTSDAAVFARMAGVFGRLNILMNNVLMSRPMVELEEIRDKVMALAFQGLQGTFYFMQEAFD